MIARCARCQQTFQTEKFGVQTCPLCGAEIHLADPSAPPAPPPPPAGTAPPGPPPGQGWGAPPAPPAGFGTPPPPGGWGPPPGAPPQPPPGSWGPIPPGGVPPPPGGDGESAPFARRGQLGWPSAFAQTMKLVAFEPSRFFRLVKVSESGSAVLFGVIGATVGTWVALLFSYFTAAASSSLMEQLARQMQEKGGLDPEAFSWVFKQVTGAAIALRALATPLLALVVIYVAAGLFHLVLLIFRGAPRGFDATLTVVGYAYGIYVLTALPMCGGLVAIVWFAVVAIAGLTEAHRGATWKAALAVFAPFLLLCLCACLAAVSIPSFLKLQGRGGPTSL